MILSSNCLGGACRKELSGQDLGFRAVLVEVKGDWEFFADILHLPRWNNVEGICFLCKATRAHLSQNDLSASWRQDEMRMDHQGLVQRLLSTKTALSPIWQFPMFNKVCLKIDWLHMADHGVTAAFAGSILCLFVDPPGLPNWGSTIEARALTLWNMLLDFYQKQGMRSDKLKSLPVSRFRLNPPVLKAQAATVRKLVPWLVQLVGYLDTSLEEHKKVVVGMLALAECYKCLSAKSNAPVDYLKTQAAIFGQQVASLHELKPDKYALLPKMHLFQELCSQGIQPSQGWLYREEDFGGSLAAMAHKEGGVDTAPSTSTTCLSRFCISAPPPSLSVPADPRGSAHGGATSSSSGV